ncbi:hypothetical protein TNCV_3847901 [Trichonephila clavipes]|nr:hypothetical protein TNCV_3847901 [Trichonephila clavipes]
MNDPLCNSHRSFALQSALSWPTSAHLEQVGWPRQTVFECPKSLALKASQRIRDVWSDWASDVGHFNCLWKYASTHHGAQQGEAAHRSSDMRQARHLPQRWYWSIVVQSLRVPRGRGLPYSPERVSLSGKEEKGGKWKARKRAENREGSLGFPGFVKPVFTIDSKTHKGEGKITRAPRERETRTHLKKAVACDQTWIVQWYRPVHYQVYPRVQVPRKKLHQNPSFLVFAKKKYFDHSGVPMLCGKVQGL